MIGVCVEGNAGWRGDVPTLVIVQEAQKRAMIGNAALRARLEEGDASLFGARAPCDRTDHRSSHLTAARFGSSMGVAIVPRVPLSPPPVAAEEETMPRPRKAPRRPLKTRVSTSETQARRTNILLEVIRTDVSVIAEDHRSLRAEFGTMRLVVEDLDERMGRVESVVITLASVPGTLQRIEKRLESFDERITALEARPLP